MQSDKIRDRQVFFLNYFFDKKYLEILHIQKKVVPLHRFRKIKPSSREALERW